MSRRGFVLDTAGLAASQVIARGVLLARGVVSAAALGPAGFGAWNALNLLLDYGAYVPAGAVQGLELRLPAAVARGDAPAGRSLLAGAAVASLAGFALFAAVVAAFVATGAAGWAKGLGGAPIALALAAVLVQLVLQLHTTAAKARGAFAAVSVATALQALVGGGAGLALVWRAGLSGLLAGWLAGGIAALVSLRVAGISTPVAPRGGAAAGTLVRAGFPVFAFFATSLLLRSVDRLALVRYGDPERLGQYAIGLMAAGLVLYLPEAAGAVLYPRVAAAREGARDGERTKREVADAQRALALALPPVVALGMVWAGPLVARALPAFREGVPALRLLASGALLLAVATVPGYYLLARGRAPQLVVFGAIAALVTGVLVFVVAARDPRPGSVALASAAGYALFAIGLVRLAAGDLFAAAGERARFVVASFVPALVAIALALGACAVGPPESWSATAARTAVVAAGCLPLPWIFGRGTGLRSLARGLAPRPSS